MAHCTAFARCLSLLRDKCAHAEAENRQLQRQVLAARSDIAVRPLDYRPAASRPRAASMLPWHVVHVPINQQGELRLGFQTWACAHLKSFLAGTLVVDLQSHIALRCSWEGHDCSRRGLDSI